MIVLQFYTFIVVYNAADEFSGTIIHGEHLICLCGKLKSIAISGDYLA